MKVVFLNIDRIENEKRLDEMVSYLRQKWRKNAERRVKKILAAKELENTMPKKPSNQYSDQAKLINKLPSNFSNKSRVAKGVKSVTTGKEPSNQRKIFVKEVLQESGSSATKNRTNITALTAKEIAQLRDYMRGYGKFKAAIEQIGLYPNTVRYILQRGHGRAKNIETIRSFLQLDQKENKRQSLCYLSQDEIELLCKLNLGYGKLIANATQCGLHPNTFRYAINRGAGTEKTITKIRNAILKK